MAYYNLSKMKLGDKIWSENYGGYLTVVSVWDGTEGRCVKLSADGINFDWVTWHKGDSEYGVYVEIRRENNHMSHGWVDAHTRRVYQIG